MKKYCLAHVVTNVCLNPDEIRDPIYDVLIDDVRGWRLTGLPVTWEHVDGEEKDECQPSILRSGGIGHVKNWWIDFTHQPAKGNKTFAVTTLLEITARDYLDSSLSQFYDSVSLSQNAIDRSECYHVSLVRTGARDGTRAVFLQRERDVCQLSKYCFGHGSRYKRRAVSNKDCVMMSRPDGKADNHEEMDKIDNEEMHSEEEEEEEEEEEIDMLAKEMELVTRVSQVLPSEDAENFIKLMEKRGIQLNEANNTRKTVSLQLSKLMRSMVNYFDKQNTPESRKRCRDLMDLETKLKRNPNRDLVQIVASFDDCRNLIERNDPTHCRSKKVDHFLNNYYKRMLAKTNKMPLTNDQTNRISRLKKQEHSVTDEYREYVRSLEKAVDAQTLQPQHASTNPQQFWLPIFCNPTQQPQTQPPPPPPPQPTAQPLMNQSKTEEVGGKSKIDAGFQEISYNFWTDRKPMEVKSPIPTELLVTKSLH